jgi:CheY-like chemotaxis protein
MPHSILVVDDAKTVRELAKRALTPLRCTVEESTNGYNALFAMEKLRPDLLVLDVKMPVMDGVELLTMMRTAPALRDLPVIMLTSPADHATLPLLTELGVAGILRKPFTEAELAAAVRAALPAGN